MAPVNNGVYWDTCIFYALLKEERHRQGELSAIKRQAGLFDDGNLFVITSAITLTEIKPSKLEDSARTQFKGMQKRSNFVWVDTNVRVAELANDLREQYTKQNAEGRNLHLSTPDAIHIASAITIGAPELITLDEDNKNKELSLGMLKIAEDVFRDYSLTIKRPGVGEMTGLFDDE